MPETKKEFNSRKKLLLLWNQMIMYARIDKNDSVSHFKSYDDGTWLQSIFPRKEGFVVYRTTTGYQHHDIVWRIRWNEKTNQWLKNCNSEDLIFHGC